MMIFARGDKDCAVAVTLGNMKAKDAAIKSKRPFDIRDFQMDMANSDPVINRVRL